MTWRNTQGYWSRFQHNLNADFFRPCSDKGNAAGKPMLISPVTIRYTLYKQGQTGNVLKSIGRILGKEVMPIGRR